MPNELKIYIAVCVAAVVVLALLSWEGNANDQRKS